MKNLEIGERNAEVFGSEAINLMTTLSPWAAENNWTFDKVNAQWPQEGFIRISRAGRWVEIAVRRPGAGGTATTSDEVWGLATTDWIPGGKGHLIARWPEGWRSCNPGTPSKAIDLIPHLKEHILGLLSPAEGTN
jgi:hypothetical protein